MLNWVDILLETNFLSAAYSLVVHRTSKTYVKSAGFEWEKCEISGRRVHMYENRNVQKKKERI